MNRVIYSRTVSYPDKENSPRLMAWIGLTEETNGFGLFEEIRLDGETEETKLVCWHLQSNIFATSNQHGMQQQKYRPPPRSRNLPCGRGQAATMGAVRLRLRRPGGGRYPPLII